VALSDPALSERLDARRAGDGTACVPERAQSALPSSPRSEADELVGAARDQRPRPGRHSEMAPVQRRSRLGPAPSW
jgi:hypothetical protein